VIADAPLLPDWETFEADYVSTGLHAFIVIRNSPVVRVFVDEGAARIGAFFELNDETAVLPSPLEEVDVREVRISGSRGVEVSTRSRALYRNFYTLVSEVSAGVISGIQPLHALETSVSAWKALLQNVAVLSEERQAGLFGELIVLQRLTGAMGPTALDAWTGPLSQAHDFRIGSGEFEVKTTAGTRRIHTINGVGQLAPSPGCSLHLVSMMLGHGGTGGRTLADLVAELTETFAKYPGALSRFTALLRDVAYRPEDAARYSRRRKLRAPMILVHVTDGCPRLVPEALAALPSDYGAGRIVRVAYDVDLTDLGIADADPRFDAILPRAATTGD
jgi:hypothetical protein